MPLPVSASSSFNRISKKFHARDKAVLDDAVKDVAKDPSIGEEKKGDLAGIFVYKFKINNNETLLAYELQPNKLQPELVVLLAVGPHENLYEQLKRNV